jgi:perosamine synthetase
MDFIPVSTPSLSSEDARAVAQAIEEGWISSEGPQVREFEEKFSAAIGVKHGVAVANGTAALDIAYEALGIGPGDEVILPSFTIVSCLGQILRSGATPVFVDSLPDTWNLNPEDVKNAITDRTKAIVVVHIYGLPADVDQISQLAKDQGIALIEDSAEAHGQHLDGSPLGSFGTLSTFSFYSNKLITTGEGGMILTDDDHLAARARELRNLSFNPEKRFVHTTIGWNYRLTAMQAALGLSQLSRMDELLAHKKEIGHHYQELHQGVEELTLPLPEYRGSDNVYWVFGVVLGAESRLSAQDAMEALHKRGIGTRPFFFPLHQQPVLKNFGITHQGSLPVSEWLGKQGFYLPNGADSTPEKREYVAQQLREVLASS